MKIKSITQKSLIVTAAAGALVLGTGGVAFAHVTVKPAEVVTAGFETFTVSVPNEKQIPTTNVKVMIPEGVNYVTPTQKPGWKTAVERSGEGEEAAVRSITWSGGLVAEGLRDEFTFSAQVPERAGELQWKAYQTYSDRTVVSWDQAEDGGHGEAGGNSGPYSITKVVADTDEAAATDAATQAAGTAAAAANRAMYVGLAGVVVGLVAIFLATRRK